LNQKECKVGVMKQLITKERVALAIAKYWKVVTPFGLFIILLINWAACFTWILIY